MAVMDTGTTAHHTHSMTTSETPGEQQTSPIVESPARYVFTKGEAENLAYIVAARLSKEKLSFLQDSALNLDAATERALNSGHTLRSHAWKVCCDEALDTLHALKDLYSGDF